MDVITHPCTDFNGDLNTAVEVIARMSDCMTQEIMEVITYTCVNPSETMSVNGSPGGGLASSDAGW